MKLRKLVVAAAITLCLGVPAFAGDVATFVDLGFSADSAFFMFGQYGLDQGQGKPYAETYIIDTGRNDFVAKGSVHKTFDASLEPGQDASGALYSLLGDDQALIKKCKIDHLKPGRLLYVLLDGQDPPASLSFRDFKTGAAYDISLTQSSSEKAGDSLASFGIAVTYTAKDGTAKRIVGGNPDIKRAGVKSYAIRRILVSPDEKKLLFIIEKRNEAKGDLSVRYMAEALSLL